MGDLQRDIARQLREPPLVARHDLAVARPAFVDPRVRTQHEAVGMREKQRAPCRCELAVGGYVVAIGQLRHQVRIPREVPAKRFRRRGEPAVRPDDLHPRIVREKVDERRFVTMRVQPETAGHGERDDALHLFRVGIAAEDMEFTDAAPADVARQLFFDQRVDRGIVEPGIPVGGRAVGADERDHPRRLLRTGAGRRGQRARAVVRPAGGENRSHVAVAEALHDVGDGVRGGRLLVVMEVSVEDRQRRGDAGGKRRDADQRRGRGGDERQQAGGAHEEGDECRRQCRTAPPAAEVLAAAPRGVAPAPGRSMARRRRFRATNVVAAHAVTAAQQPSPPQ